MRTAADDDTFAHLEEAADRAHLSNFEKAHVGEGARAKIVSSLGSCMKAATDLERFLANAAPRARHRAVHDGLYRAAELVGELPGGLAAALHSIDERAEAQGTARGALHRATLGAKLIVGPDDETVLADVEKEVLHAIAVYDEALETLAKTLGGFVVIVEDQRRLLSRIHRALEELRAGP